VEFFRPVAFCLKAPVSAALTAAAMSLIRSWRTAVWRKQLENDEPILAGER
jgi:hypothetical protein